MSFRPLQTLCILLIYPLIFQATANAQSPLPKVTYNGKAPLHSILDNIVHQVKYSYFIAEESKALDHVVFLHADALTLDSVLNTLLKPFSLDYTISGKMIRIQRQIIKNTIETDSSFLFFPVSGTIISIDSKEPLQFVTVSVKGASRKTITDVDGRFTILVKKGDVLDFSSINMETKSIRIADSGQLTIQMSSHTSTIREYNVIGKVNNGYAKTHKLKTVGSFDLIDRTLIERSSSPYIYDRIENLSPGLIINHGGQDADGSTIPNTMLIRGLSTINANATPLQIVDNFPYDGDIRNINPNDIENISILKDAAAAAIWGARAGNGVLVITTRRGTTPIPRITYQTSLSYQQAPDVFNIRMISAKDFIDREKYLFDNGAYDEILYGSASRYLPVTPVVETLQSLREGSISRSDADSRIAAWEQQDVRKDIRKYFYHNRLSQQQSLQISGSSTGMNYFFSVNWDHDPSSLVRSSYDRFSLRSQNTFRITDKFSLDAGINLAEGITQNGGNPGYQYRSPHGGKSFYPYARFVDDHGNPLPVYMDYKRAYIDTTAALGFLSWQYDPVKDLAAETNRVVTRDYLFNTGMQYRISPSFTAEIKYQLEDQLTSGKYVHSDSSYFARDLVNSFTQVNPITNSLSYPVPPGGVLDARNDEMLSHQGRAQVNFNSSWGPRHILSALGGLEIRSLVRTTNIDRYYGYQGDTSTINSMIDYAGSYGQYLVGGAAQIPSPQAITRLTDHFISQYASASYQYQRRYSIFGSLRFDEANLFGVRTNNKGIPLWSAGLAWQLDNEPFYHLPCLPFLKLKTSYGYSGNFSRNASAYPTTVFAKGGATGSPYTTGNIQNPSNKDLRWEQVAMFNLGLEFSSAKNIIAGTLEYYSKKSSDLIAKFAVDPTLGYTQNAGEPSYMYGNTAGMTGNGLDIQLQTHNIDKKFKWTTNFIFSHNVSKITSYSLPPDRNIFLQQNTINPVKDRPVYAIYSYKWEGLDPATGDPQGMLNGKTSKAWSDIINATPPDSMVYNGPSQPTSFGAIRNTVSYRHFSASFNISYKLGYYFRKPSVIYSSIFNGWTGNDDYQRRWINAGDEKRTEVPSLPSLPSVTDPGNIARDNFYTYSSALVKKADNIRLEDINISYELNKEQYSRLPFAKIRIFLYCSNMGLVWTANKDGIDPYYINIPKDRKKITLGLNIQF